MAPSTHHSITFNTIDGTSLGGFYYPSTPHSPVIIISHGFSCLISHSLHTLAAAFQCHGYASLIYDHRPTHTIDVDPNLQISDFHDATTFLTSAGFPHAGTFSATDIVAFGYSYAGGHVIAAGANDRRIKAVIALCPFLGGRRTRGGQGTTQKVQTMVTRIWEDRAARCRGEPPVYIPIVTPTPEKELAVLPSRDAYEFFLGENTGVDGWVNRVTLQSLQMCMAYTPETFLETVAPAGLLMIVGTRDVETAASDQREAFKMAREPKEWAEIDMNHFGVFSKEETRARVVEICASFLTRQFKRAAMDLLP